MMAEGREEYGALIYRKVGLLDSGRKFGLFVNEKAIA